MDETNRKQDGITRRRFGALAAAGAGAMVFAPAIVPGRRPEAWSRSATSSR